MAFWSPPDLNSDLSWATWPQGEYLIWVSVTSLRRGDDSYFLRQLRGFHEMGCAKCLEQCLEQSKYLAALNVRHRMGWGKHTRLRFKCQDSNPSSINRHGIVVKLTSSYLSSFTYKMKIITYLYNSLSPPFPNPNISENLKRFPWLLMTKSDLQWQKAVSNQYLSH